MFIEYLELENFEGIDATMHASHISVDFTGRKNKICLITGPNGKGKTVLLSQLNPFATLGNIDVRDDLNLIIEGKTGHKRIVIVNHKDRYEIDHFYTPSKGSHTVKSYIKKNGEELNPNGNVTSFKEKVREHLDIEQDYMKLIRLGNNVSNMITLKSTERKAFMSKLLEDANIYLKHYKKISADTSVVKSLISHLGDKLRKTAIHDLDESREELKTKKSVVASLEEESAELGNRLSVIEFQLSEIPENVQELLRDARKKFSKLKNIGDESFDDMQDKEKKLSIKLATNHTRQQMLEESISNATRDIDTHTEELNHVLIDIERVSSSVDVDGLKHIIQELKDAIMENSKLYDTQEQILHHKSDIEELLSFLKEKQEILNTTYGFGKEPIVKAVSLIRNNRDCTSYVERKIAEIDALEEDMDAKRFINRLLRDRKNLTIPKGCPGGCYLTSVLSDMMDAAKNVEGKKERSREFYSYVNLCYINIKNVILSFGEKKELFVKLPNYIQNMFLTETVLSHIEATDWIFDQKILFNELSFITDYDNYLEMIDELEEKEKELSHYLKDTPLPFLKENARSLSEKIQYLKEEKTKNIASYRELEQESELLKVQIEEMQSLLSLIQKREELEKTKEELEEKYEKYQRLEDEKREKEMKLRQVMFNKSKYLQEVSSLEHAIEDFKSLKKELRVYEDSYDDLLALKDALSSTKGIPLVFIDLYLKKAKKIVNDLLYQIYDGSMEIDKFNINGSEFTIPFIKDGKIVKDIIHASQGEQSFFSIALSFAISFQSMSHYNIMLLDELDSVLDTSNREHFISILEKLIDMIKGEQIFIISHNNMFSMYPVDYISVVDVEPESNRYTNYIKIEKTI